MPAYNLVVIVTLLALILYLHMGVRVASARGKYDVAAPAVTGSPEFERAYRVQMNTLEWLPLFLPSLWLFAAYWNQFLAAVLGLVWILGRMLYMISYTKDPAKRGPGFSVQALATLILLLGALGKAAWSAAHGGV